MIQVKHIYDYINKLAPFKESMSFDNVGLLIGDFDSKIKKIVLTLDITLDVCEEANNIGANLIISHHPIIFKPLKNLSFKSPVSKLIKHEINVISAHTNLDFSKEGVNFHLAKILDIKNLSPITFEENIPIGLIGNLENEIDSLDLAKLVKNKLFCDGLRYTETNKKIKKIALCSGAGGNLINKVIEKNADAFITGEIKHNEIIEANNKNICIIDAGHFKTENIILLPLKKELQLKFPSIEFIISESFIDKIKYL